MVWPDEIFQTLEQGHRFAFGLGIIPWEFRDGARSWVFPGLLGLAYKAASTLGVTKALTFVRIMKVGMAAFSILGVRVMTRLARHLGGERAELLAAVFGAVCPVLVIFASRCSTEVAAAPLVVLAAYMLEVTPRARRAAVAGALMALSVLFRYQTGLMAAGFGLLLLGRGRWGQFLAYVAGALPVAAAGGAVDKLTWGKPFAPLQVYVKSNLAPGGADRFGVSPFTFFTDHLASSIGVTYAVLVLGFAIAAWRSPGLVLVVLLFVIPHCMIAHKELRFISPVLPLAASLAAAGLAQAFDGLGRRYRPTYALAVACALLMTWQLRAPTLGELGYGTDEQVVWHANENYYRASLDAAEDPELCGISYVGTPHAWTSGYTYLHRNVPVFFDLDPRDLAAANYVVAGRDDKVPPPFRSVKVYGKYALFYREGYCGPVPPGWTLNQL